MWVGQHVGELRQPLHSQLAARTCRGERPRRGRGTRLPMSRVLRLEDRGPAPGTAGSRASGGRRWESGSAPAAPPRGRALHPREEGDACLQTRGRGRPGERPGGGRPPVSGSRRPGPSAGSLHPARCRPSRPVQPPRLGSGACCPPAAAAAAAGSSQAAAAATGTRPHNAFFSHPHRPTLPCGMPLGEEGRARSPRHDSPAECRDRRAAPGCRGPLGGTSRAREAPEKRLWLQPGQTKRFARPCTKMTAPVWQPSWYRREVFAASSRPLV